MSCTTILPIGGTQMNRIKDVRKARGMTQVELAERSGMSQAGLSRIEGGVDLSMTADTLVKIARALEVSSDYLLGLTDDPRPVIEGPPITLQEWAIIQCVRDGNLRQALRLLADEGPE